MILNLYRIIGVISYPLILVYLLIRRSKGKEDKKRFNERFGLTNKCRPKGYLIWLHGASVGESLSLLPLIVKLRELYPEFNLLITTGTVASAYLMKERLPSGVIHQYIPVDQIVYVRRFLSHWRPSLALWAESDFWPNLITEIAYEKVPLILVQGRVSLRTHARWRVLPWFIKMILSKFSLCLAQTEVDRVRLSSLGASLVKSVGNLKLAASPLPFDQEQFSILKTKFGSRSIWLAASTHPSEEEKIWKVHREIATHFPNLLTIIVPRHSERGVLIRKDLSRLKAVVALRSENEEVEERTQIYIADTIGELGLFYRLVDIVFMGKSFVDLGGQNLIEPAHLQNAILHGPYMWNFDYAVKGLREKDAIIRVENCCELVAELIKLFSDTSYRSKFQKRALKFAESEAVSVDRISRELEPFLKKIDRK